MIRQTLALFVMLLCMSTANGQKNPPDHFLVSSTLIKQHTKASISAIWKKNHIPKAILPVRNDVDIYEIIYKAPWIDSTTWINCSGIVYVPKLKKGKKASTFMFGHGTEIRKGRSISDDDSQQGICLGFAADGYFALYPDYYGIGKGDGNHLYQHAWSEGMAFIYMRKAVEEMKAQVGVETNDQLFLTGYSQGGHASFAAHKYFEEVKDPRFKVTASSPMSGAYDMTGEQAKYMFQKYPRPFYLPYLLISYQEAYKVINTDNIYSIFKSPFDTLLPGFFGEVRAKSYGDLDRIMPPIPKDIVKDELVEQFVNNPQFNFLLRLKENNLTDWKPEAPVQLCFCNGDREVNYKNSEVVYNNMTAMGKKDIKLNNLSPKLDHNTCAAFAVLATKYFFDRYRKHGKNPKMKDVPPFKKFLVGIIKKKIEKDYEKTGSDHAYR
jgi:hypothetical protein